jgi:hypothetical protein
MDTGELRQPLLGNPGCESVPPHRLAEVHPWIARALIHGWQAILTHPLVYTL